VTRGDPNSPTNRSTDSSVSTSFTLSLPYLDCPHSPRLLIRSWKSPTVSPGLANAEGDGDGGFAEVRAWGGGGGVGERYEVSL
jgi:hypothetical protein